MIHVEYAGAGFHADLQAKRNQVLARAPAWWRDLALQGTRSRPQSPGTRPTPRPAAKPSPTLGWIFGIANVGLSEPVMPAGGGGMMAREQFTDSALADIAKRQGGSVIELRWGHRGEVLTTNRGLNLVLRHDPRFGLTFTARLKDTPLHRHVMDELSKGLVGVSVGFTDPEGWTMDRRGVGVVRVVSRARLDHIALLRPDSKALPAYRACWAAGRLSAGPGCPVSVRRAAEQRALEEMKRQPAVMA